MKAINPLAIIVAVAFLAVPAFSAPPKRLEGHTNVVRSLAFSPNGKTIASASYDGTVRLWRIAENKSRILIPGPERPSFAAFSPDGARLITACGGGVLKTCDLLSGEMQSVTNRSHGDYWGLALSPIGGLRATASTDWKLRIESNESPVEINSAADQLAGLAFSPDGKRVASGGAKKANIWNASNGAHLKSFDHPGQLYAVDFSPDGQTLLTACADQIARLWNVNSGTLVHKLEGNWGQVHAVAFAPDGKTLAVGCADSYVRIYNTSSGKIREALAAHQKPVWSLAYSPDGRALASGSEDGTILLWDLTKLREISPNLPPQVDLRPNIAKWGLRPKGQYNRNTCGVHTFTLNLECALAARTGKGVRLSDEFNNWAVNQIIGNTGPTAADRGQWVEHQWMALGRYGICEERLLPFTKTFNTDLAPSAEALANAARFNTNHFVYSWIEGDGITRAEKEGQIKTILARGIPVQALQSHCVLVVGYKDDPSAPGGGYFIIADSGWGGGGGGYIVTETGMKYHSIINYANLNDHGWAWIE